MRLLFSFVLTLFLCLSMQTFAGQAANPCDPRNSQDPRTQCLGEDCSTLGATAADKDLINLIACMRKDLTNPNLLVWKSMTSGSTAELIVQSSLDNGGGAVQSFHCQGGVVTGHTCPGIFYSDVMFPKQFTSIPKVLVSPAQMSVSPDEGWATDQVRSYAGNITTNGFRMYCAGSPPANTAWPATEGQSIQATCNWIAIGY